MATLNEQVQSLADLELLRRAIQASGQTPRQFARQTLARDRHIVRLWLSGRALPLPRAVREKCEAILRTHGDTDGDLA